MNITATSLDSEDELSIKYMDAVDNINILKRYGCDIQHEVDVHTMSFDNSLSLQRYDRIVFNFPHAGSRFFGRELSSRAIESHKELVRGFLENAKEMLEEDGEIHITHKTTYPFSDWGIKKLGKGEGLKLLKKSKFELSHYPGYINKRGSGGRRSDDYFPVDVDPCDLKGFEVLEIYHPSMSDGFVNSVMVARKLTDRLIKFVTYPPPLSVPPSAPQSPNFSGGLRSQPSFLVEQEKYLSELLAERHKLTPFLPVLPHVCRLMNQEILRVTTLLENALSQSRFDHPSPLASGGIFQNSRADMNGWASQFPSERSVSSSPAPNWLNSPGSSSGLIVKRTIRVDIPVDKYPNYNFVGRLLGPRGNSLKRVEASTDCRVLIRGRGSIKDPIKEDMMRGKPGYEHLNEPLHILVEAELPIEIVDARLMQAREILDDLLTPVEETHDFYKKQQLRELALLNGSLREEGSPMSGSISPYNSLGMKRAKTRG
ncbi:unnamed protein product [Arabidopsis thaliana]|nr:unnamed protein product [Arabidopsis thaliana]